MLDVAIILIKRGHNVILLTSGKYEPSSEYPGLKQISSGPQPFTRQLNDIREQMNIKSVSGKVPKVTLALINIFFGFELPQSLAPNVQVIGPVLSEEYPSLTPELSDFINGHQRVLYIAFAMEAH
ncbi:unnamed protein product [Rhizophagus irregularis]|uniref:UDP-Glycosyltransferase/glycogen phosphorylase n=1 Tax=Rhizophagus irregularis TaxID=588596 RepID=A0A915Z875_9GLOM|nr:unnamed protein product [Rhizophagus irregularis]CAB5364644.1 unnamed protein product [Rhizophagus irregularis]